MLHRVCLYIFFISFSLLSSCEKKSSPEPITSDLVGTWRPGAVQLNSTGLNLAGANQPYNNFTITFNVGATDDEGTFNISNFANVNPSSFSGNWNRSASTLVLTNRPIELGNITDLSVNGNTINFKVEVQSMKTGTIILSFTLNKL